MNFLNAVGSPANVMRRTLVVYRDCGQAVDRDQ